MRTCQSLRGRLYPRPFLCESLQEKLLVSIRRGSHDQLKRLVSVRYASKESFTNSNLLQMAWFPRPLSCESLQEKLLVSIRRGSHDQLKRLVSVRYASNKGSNTRQSLFKQTKDTPISKCRLCLKSFLFTLKGFVSEGTRQNVSDQAFQKSRQLQYPFSHIYARGLGWCIKLQNEFWLSEEWSKRRDQIDHSHISGYRGVGQENQFDVFEQGQCDTELTLISAMKILIVEKTAEIMVNTMAAEGRWSRNMRGMSVREPWPLPLFFPRAFLTCLIQGRDSKKLFLFVLSVFIGFVCCGQIKGMLRRVGGFKKCDSPARHVWTKIGPYCGRPQTQNWLSVQSHQPKNFKVLIMVALRLQIGRRNWIGSPNVKGGSKQKYIEI